MQPYSGAAAADTAEQALAEAVGNCMKLAVGSAAAAGTAAAVVLEEVEAGGIVAE